MRLPIKAKLTGWNVILFTAILVGLCAYLLLSVRADLVSELDHSLALRTAQISLGLKGGGEGEFVDVSTTALAGLAQAESAAQLLGADGSVLESTGDPVSQSPMISPQVASSGSVNGPLLVTEHLGSDSEAFRIMTSVAPSGSGKHEVLVVAASLDEVGLRIHHLLMLLLVAGPIALAATALAGWWIANRALSPVKAMTDRAEDVRMERLDERVPVPPARDELARLARTMNAMLDRLQAGIEDKRRFLADASHELRTPLATIRSEMEAEMLSEDLPTRTRKMLTGVMNDAERMSGTLDNMLTLARVDEGKLDLLVSTFDVREVTGSVAAAVSRLAQSHDVSVSVSDDEVRVTADRERLRLAVLNLVENAVKYAGRGAEVRVGARRTEDEVVIDVTDDGPGIPPSAIPQIFDRFFRMDGTRGTLERGSGLGLAIAKEIAEAHGGHVSCDSTLGRGSTFQLVLPAVKHSGGAPT